MTNDTFIGGGLKQYGTLGAPAPALVSVDPFDSNTMIGTDRNAFGTVDDAVVEAGRECQFNSWRDDAGFVFRRTGAIPQLACGSQRNNAFAGPFGSGSIRTAGAAVAAKTALYDAGPSVAPYQLGRPMAGVSATAAATGITLAVFTNSPSLDNVVARRSAVLCSTRHQ